jgi:hypothetical protein
MRQCAVMTTESLAARLSEIFDAGGGEPAAEAQFLPLVTLDSGARCGLDREARWLLVPDDGRPPVRFDASAAYLFHEALEWRRARFDDALEAAARAHGLPPDDVVLGFPAIYVIRAVLSKQHPYLTRLALEWVGPTELRELRIEIREVTRTANMPVAVRELAERMVVPE